MDKVLKKVKVAIIGYGFLGKWHAEKAFLLENANLVAIVECSKELRQKAQEKYSKVQVVSSIAEVIDLIDAAIIVTPTSTHFEIVDYLLNHNKHVFCEKPLTSDGKDAEKLQKTLSKKNLVLQVGHSERFHEIWEKEEIYKPFLKPPFSIHIFRYAPFKGRAVDVDVVQDLMIHDLDLLSMLTQAYPSVTQSTGYKSLTDKWDYVDSSFALGGQNKGRLVAGRHSVEECRKIEIMNKKGTLKVDLLNNLSTWTEGKELMTQQFKKRDHLYLEQEEFYFSILNGERPRVDCKVGVEAVLLVNEVLSSLN